MSLVSTILSLVIFCYFRSVPAVDTMPVHHPSSLPLSLSLSGHLLLLPVSPSSRYNACPPSILSPSLSLSLSCHLPLLPVSVYLGHGSQGTIYIQCLSTIHPLPLSLFLCLVIFCYFRSVPAVDTMPVHHPSSLPLSLSLSGHLLLLPVSPSSRYNACPPSILSPSLSLSLSCHLPLLPVSVYLGHGSQGTIDTMPVHHPSSPWSSSATSGQSQQ